jgi:GNAT superfamily N-acetyltransferase
LDAKVTHTYEIAEVTAVDLEPTVHWITDYYYGGDAREGQRHFSGHFDKATTFVARLGDKIVGFLTLSWCSNNPTLKEAGIPFIHQLEVADPHKRKGLGSRLMAAAEARAAERSDKIATCVGPGASYGPAQCLYATRGYMPDGRGLCKGHVPIEEGESFTLKDNLQLWLIKDLDANFSAGKKEK